MDGANVFGGMPGEVELSGVFFGVDKQLPLCLAYRWYGITVDILIRVYTLRMVGVCSVWALSGVV